MHQRLETMHEDREVTRLGDSVFRVVATSSLRKARNPRVFMDWVRSTTGWRGEVISGLEEGRLIHLALMANMRVYRCELRARQKRGRKVGKTKRGKGTKIMAVGRS